MAWEDLSRDAKISQLIDAVTLTAVGAVERVEANRYVDAKARIKDPIDVMRLDVEFWFPLIQKLRKENRIPSAQEIRAKAESLVELSSDDMRKALHEYDQVVREGKWQNSVTT